MQTVAASIPDPALEPAHCNSWIVVDRTTGKPVLETYSRTMASAINQARYEVLTAYAWLVRFNRSLREVR